MAAYTVTPAAASASADGFAPGNWEDPREYAAMVAKRVDHKYKLGPAASEIMALIAGSVASYGHRKSWTCVSGLAVGDPVYVSAADTVTLADATTAAKAKVIGFCRYKPTTTSCYLDLVMRKTGLTGLTAGAVVYLSDAGAIAATAGTVSTVIGTALSTTEAEAVACSLFSPATQTESSASSLLLNGGFETVLYGTHTSAIKTHGVAATVKNTQFPGWQGFTPAGSPSMAVDAETTTISTSGSQSCKVSSVALGTSSEPVWLEQRWNSANLLEPYATQCRGRYITFALDVKLSTGTADACRIGISLNGGINYTYSAYKANDTNWERLLVSVSEGIGATDIRFRIAFASATPSYYLDNGMAVTSAAALTALPFLARSPVNIVGAENVSDAFMITWTTPTAAYPTFYATGDGEADTDYNINTNRPHWATNVSLLLSVLDNGAGAGSFFCVRPSGATISTAYRVITPTAYPAYNMIGCDMIPLGADGQLQYACSNTNLDQWTTLRHWGGFDL